MKVVVATAGSGQKLPLPMNEVLQENLKQACNGRREGRCGRVAGIAERRPCVPRTPRRSTARCTAISRRRTFIFRLFMVHDLKLPCVQQEGEGFVSLQPWFVDLTLVNLDEALFGRRRRCGSRRRGGGRGGLLDRDADLLASRSVRDLSMQARRPHQDVGADQNGNHERAADEVEAAAAGGFANDGGLGTIIVGHDSSPG
jgi:hypothetical protein